MLEELNDRQRTILKYIVQEYVQTGRAVGSKTLIERYRMGVSPATVRNEMGELEERNFLQHPHTSAGRVPTDLGYRYYVEYLLDDLGLPPTEEIRIRHQFGQVESQIEAWAKLAASILADVSGNLALVTPPRSAIERLRHMELISLRDQVVLLVVVTQSGGAQELILTTGEIYAQEELSAISRRLNDELVNLSAREILALRQTATRSSVRLSWSESPRHSSWPSGRARARSFRRASTGRCSSRNSLRASLRWGCSNSCAAAPS